MTCSRCGQEAAVKRDAAFYCGKCAMARDWEDVIAIVQGDGPHADLISFDAAPAPAAAPSPAAPEPVSAPAPEPVVELLSALQAEAPAPEVVVEEPKVAASASAAGNDLPADPFA